MVTENKNYRYASIPHLPGSSAPKGDESLSRDDAHQLTQKTQHGNSVYVDVKVDGACCVVARDGDSIQAYTRSGNSASASPHPQHKMFAAWVRRESARFKTLLTSGERVVGDWVAMAHGTKYHVKDIGEIGKLPLPCRESSPYVVFDIFDNQGQRLPRPDLWSRCSELVQHVRCIHVGDPATIPYIESKIRELSWDFNPTQNIPGISGELDPIEGAVWRLEECGRVTMLGKWVKPGFVAGFYLPDISGLPSIWNWRMYQRVRDI